MSDPGSWSVPHARIEWRDDAPHDPESGDIFFSRTDGRAESECVFLRGNGLEQRWSRLDPARPGVFVVGETGFGSGLNFLLTQDRFLRTAPPACQLHYVSVEHRPWTRADLRRAHAQWPELAQHARDLQAQWPPPLRGPHRLHLAGDRVRLTLLFDEAAAALAGLQAGIHAWYLDGFAPARDAAIWRPAVLREVARLSAPGATLATYTAAGAVRRALGEHGFVVERLPGFAGKRHRLVARLPAAEPASPRPLPGPVAVIGAGFAGASCALALSRRGLATTVIEGQPQPASGASGVPQAVLYLKLSGACSDVARLQLHALRYAMAQTVHCPVDSAVAGVLQLGDAAQCARWEGLAAVPADLLQPVDRQQAAALAGIPLQSGGLWFPGAFALPGADFCNTRLTASGATFMAGRQVTGLAAGDEGDWNLQLSGSGPASLRAAAVICCGGTGPSLQGLPLHGIRGQLTRFRADATVTPRCVLTGAGHVIPLADGSFYAGSSYAHDNPSLAPVAGDDAENRLRAAGLLGCAQQDLSPVAAWVGLRCAGPDHLPAAGALPGPAGNFTLTGLRSRGLLFSPLLAEAIASELCGEPLPLTRPQWRSLDPGRWLRGKTGNPDQRLRK